MNEFTPAQRVALDRLEESYRQQYAAAVETIKERVGAGEEYNNSVARAVVSERGAWCECIDLPMEFTGLAGAPPRCRFVSDADARCVLTTLHGASIGVGNPAPAVTDLFVLYARAGIADEAEAHVRHWRQASPNGEPNLRVVGTYLQDRLPLFYRARFSTTERIPGLECLRGAVFCIAAVGEMNLLVELAHEGGAVYDLGAGPTTPLPQ